MPATVSADAPTRPAFPEHVPDEVTERPQDVFDRPDVLYGGPKNARTVLGKRYLKKNLDLEVVEEPEDMFWRVATHIAKEELRYGADLEAVQEVAERFYELMVRGLWEPNSPTLMNAGRELGQLSACFVLPVEDAIRNGEDGIYDTLGHMAEVHQSGGGTGFGWSRLRPRGDIVKSTRGVASGPVSFMEVYDASTEAVKQGGTRRGANMGVLRIDHPDIEEFIRCKDDTDRITNFNISVAVTDAFMEAVEAGTDYDLVNPRTGEVEGQLDARAVFDDIVHHAWKTGEPGVLFIDEANRSNPVPQLGDYEASNPCGEQFLLAWDVCNLGSINVGRFVDADADEDASWAQRVDWEALERVTKLSTRFLDNVIDANNYPLPQIDERSLSIRRIGNGIMGFADLLVRLGIPYDSEQGVVVGRELQRRIHRWELEASEALARERGTFPEWEASIWGPDATCARDEDGERIRPERPLRNCNVNTVAPTGTISIIADCSGGIEPLFAVAFMRNQAGELMPDVNDDFVRIAKERGFYSEELIERIAEEGHIHMEEVPEDVQRIFPTANEIAPEWHVRMQAAFQEHVDNAISKTVNFAQEATEEDVRTIYELAHELGCKGVTVYRDGSRQGQVLSTGKGTVSEQEAGGDYLREKLAEAEAELKTVRARLEQVLEDKQDLQLRLAEQHRRVKRDRPETLVGKTKEVNSPLGTMYVTINEDGDGEPFEVFVHLGKAGGSAMADAEGIGRLISLALRSGIPVREVHKQLRGISSDRAVGMGPNKVHSTPDAIAIAIERYLEEREGIQQELPMDEAVGGADPSPSPDQAELADLEGGRDRRDRELEAVCGNCGSNAVAFEEGCLTCHACGESKCS